MRRSGFMKTSTRFWPEMSSEKRTVFESLYQEYFPMVFQLSLGFVKGDRPRADDLSQEVFINIWNGLEKFQGKSSYKTWIYRITVNTCLQFLRKDQKRRTDPIPETGLDMPSPGRNEAADEQSERLYQAIGRLEELDRLIIMMVLDELKYEEIANVIGVSEATLRVKIHRIKARLKKLINHD